MKYKVLFFFTSLFSYNAFCAENIQLIKNFSTSNYFDGWGYSIFPHDLEKSVEKKQFQNSNDKIDVNLSKTWIAQNDFHNNILSCRLKDNITSLNGDIIFVTSKYNCPNKSKYSTAYLDYYKSIHYGYYQARIKSASKGINNAFWFKSNNGYEIDIAEIHSPNIINVTIHKWIDGKPLSYGFIFKTTSNLSNEFHLYGMEWKTDNMIFYFDNKPILRVFGFGDNIESGTLKLSTAVSRYSGYDSKFRIDKNMTVSNVIVTPTF
ncbi:glycoside hydrolase family 16 protein [Klebsiella aerogenes]